jgi:hypothetical protein
MALNNMTFTNATGTITLTRIMQTISHRYVWDGNGPARKVTSITVNGTFKAIEDELNKVAGEGQSGTLELPNKTYNDMNVLSMSYESGVWAPWGRVTIQFDNENSAGFLDDYTVTWYGYTVYNPKLVVNPSTIKTATTATRGINGWERQELGHSTFTLTLTGSIITPSGIPPTGFVETLEKKYDQVSDPYPTGYPLVFELKDAIPEASGHLTVHECVVAGGKAAWNVEDNSAEITVDMIAPPQTWT